MGCFPRRDFLTGGLQIMDVAMGILREQRGCGMRMRGERAAGLAPKVRKSRREEAWGCGFMVN